MALFNPISFERVTDANGNPISGAKAYVYDANTSSLPTIYTTAAGSVSAANPIISDSAGIFPNRYFADGTYDIKYTDASDVQLGPTREDIVVVASSGGGGGGDTYDFISKTSNYAVQASDVNGKVPVFLVDASGIPGLEAIITIDAGALGIDKAVGVINVGATGVVRVQPDAGETIDGAADVVLVSGTGQFFGCIGATGWLTISSTQPGIPAGGTTGQALVKSSNSSYATTWATRREVLTGNRTYYVRTDGNDSNTGLANDSANAFLTIQKAINVAHSLDFAGFAVTIQIADGTYTGSVTIKPMTGAAGAAGLIIQGNAGTPANVVISTTNADCFVANERCAVTIQNMELRTTTAGYGLSALHGGIIRQQNLRFGAIADFGQRAWYGGQILILGNYTVAGSAKGHVYALEGGSIIMPVGSASTITFSGTPAWSVAGSKCEAALIDLFLATYSGAATGKRGETVMNGVNYAATTFPGNSAATAATGGQHT